MKKLPSAPRALKVWRALTFCALLFATPSLLLAQPNSAAYQPFRDGEYQRAIQLAENELLNNPNSIDTLIVLSWSNLATRQYQNALSHALRVLELVPSDDRAVAVAGEAYYELGRDFEALPLLERYVALAPEGIAIARIHAIMGEIFVRFGEYHHASAAFAAAVAFDASVFLWWQRLGFVYEQLSYFALAAEAYERALQLRPTDEETQRAIARVQR